MPAMPLWRPQTTAAGVWRSPERVRAWPRGERSAVATTTRGRCGRRPGPVQGGGPGSRTADHRSHPEALDGARHPLEVVAVPPVKQHLAAIRMFGDWLVVS